MNPTNGGEQGNNVVVNFIQLVKLACTPFIEVIPQLREFAIDRPSIQLHCLLPVLVELLQALLGFFEIARDRLDAIAIAVEVCRRQQLLRFAQCASSNAMSFSRSCTLRKGNRACALSYLKGVLASRR